MGYVSWHNYGYGVCVSDIGEVTPERIEKLLSCAPNFHQKVKAWLEDNEISEPTYEDYMSFDEDFNLGLATFLAEVIEEAEGVFFTACDDFDDNDYLIYQPSYPWKLAKNELDLTEEKIEDMLTKYIRMLTEEKIAVNYHEVENGG